MTITFQISYSIGIAEPLAIYIDVWNWSNIAIAFQISYSIDIAEPLIIYIDMYGTGIT